jgi:glyoxylase-like metal-dependent hydrolase (beta-lactamase superfamily II)
MYEIYALKGGEREVDSSSMFYRTDSGKKTMMAYYFLCFKGKEYTVLLDTGISSSELAVRGITGCPTREELLGRINISPGDVDAVILTHLHDDHFAGPELYPNCIFYVQRQEFRFWSEDAPRFNAILGPPFLKGKPAVAIEALQRLNFQGRVRFLDGDSEVYPGIRALWCGAHTPGSQIVTVQTGRGTILCCSDFIYAYRNLEEQIPVGVLINLAEWLNGIGKIELMRLPRESVVPGHDPQVMTMFPEVARDVVRIA